MSVVVAVKKGKDLVLGADSQETFGARTPAPGNMTGSKISRVGSALMACTGWGLYQNILNDYVLGKKAIRLSTEHDVFRFFLSFWKALHDKYSFVNDQCEEEDSPFGELDASFLVATKKRIFFVTSQMSVCEFHKFHAIGAGSDFSIGAMHVLYEQELNAEQIARMGADAAIAHDIYCGGEIQIERP